MGGGLPVGGRFGPFHWGPPMKKGRAMPRGPIPVEYPAPDQEALSSSSEAAAS